MSGDAGKFFTTKDIVVLALFQMHTDFEDFGDGSGEPIRKRDEYTGQTKDELTKHLIGVNAIDDDHNVDVKKQKLCDELATEELFEQFPWLGEVDKSFQNSGCTPYVKSSEEKQALVKWMQGVVEKHGKWQAVQPSDNAPINSSVENGAVETHDKWKLDYLPEDDDINNYIENAMEENDLIYEGCSLS